jgi:hypothetical protein
MAALVRSLAKVCITFSPKKDDGSTLEIVNSSLNIGHEKRWQTPKISKIGLFDCDIQLSCSLENPLRILHQASIVRRLTDAASR